jgi:alkanesulfonate monooxygenase SsuD/methylene tetrahydromethanopterin reductase-like flavin-dependent oxidoreductase (luciferase family)
MPRQNLTSQKKPRHLGINDQRSEALDAVRLRAARTLCAGRPVFYTLEALGLKPPEAVRASVAHVAYNAGTAPYEAVKGAISDEMVRAVMLGGTPDDLQAQLRALFAAGIDGVIVAPLPAKGHTAASTLERFAEEVWQPLLRSGVPEWARA